MLWLLGLVSIVSLLDGVVEVALPVHVRLDVGSGAGLYGLIVAGYGVGSLLGTFVLGTGRIALPVRSLTMVVACGWGIVTAALGLIAVPAGLLADAVAIGLFWGPFGATTIAAVHEDAPPDALARAMNAVASVQSGAMPVGLAIAGPVVASTSASTTIVGAGAVAAGVSAAMLCVARRPRRA